MMPSTGYGRERSEVGYIMKPKCATCAFAVFSHTLCGLNITRIINLGDYCDNWIKKGAQEEKIKEIIDAKKELDRRINE